MREKIDKSVFLLPVSKTKDYSMIMEAYFEGARCFGENRVQEVAAKFPAPDQRPDGMEVFLIGQLQRNKVRKAVALCDRIESVDSIALLQDIDRESARIGRRMPVLLEFNSSGEEQKSGFRTPEELLEALDVSLRLEAAYVIGIMTVGPLGFDETLNRTAFSKTRRLFERMKEKSSLISVLSMGMSADYEVAIEEGSNEVRIGSAIFGGRS